MFVAHSHHGKDVSQIVGTELLAAIEHQATGFVHAGVSSQEGLRLACGPMMKDLLACINNPSKKLSLLSAHDTTVLPMLARCGIRSSNSNSNSNSKKK